VPYCVMPLLYGEGERAFVRLQEEIMKVSDDHSLFAWRDTSREVSNDHYLFEQKRIVLTDCPLRGLLAKSPAEFILSCNNVPLYSNHTSAPYSTTNRGLCIELILLPGLRDDIYAVVLDCADTTQYCGPLGIYLRCLSPPNSDQFARIFPNELQPTGRTCGDCADDILPARTI
jgi:hypothetical protein